MRGGRAFNEAADQMHMQISRAKGRKRSQQVGYEESSSQAGRKGQATIQSAVRRSVVPTGINERGVRVVRAAAVIVDCSDVIK